MGRKGVGEGEGEERGEEREKAREKAKEKAREKVLEKKREKVKAKREKEMEQGEGRLGFTAEALPPPQLAGRGGRPTSSGRCSPARAAWSR